MSGKPNFFYKVIYPDFKPSEAVTHTIESHLKKLERHCENITSCEVKVRSPHRHGRERIYHINIRLEIPRKVFSVSREPERNHAHHDINVAIRDAFRALLRQVTAFVKHRKERPHPVAGSNAGVILRFDPAEGYGFIGDGNGREIFFHENSVIGGNSGRIQKGAHVRYHEELGEKGPQASSMHLLKSS